MRAFVLSGGASLGAIQVGMLHALFEREIAPDLIVGTSAGAINGTFIATREPTVATAEALGDVWRGLRRGAVFPTNPLTGFIGFIGRSDHLVPDGTCAASSSATSRSSTSRTCTCPCTSSSPTCSPARSCGSPTDAPSTP